MGEGKKMPLRSFKVGNVQCAEWPNEYKGEVTDPSYTFDKLKYNATTKQVEKSNFYTLADLRDLFILLSRLVYEVVKVQILGEAKKPAEAPTNNSGQF